MFVLVAVHVAAFGFWCWLLWSSRRNKQQDDGGRNGAASAGSSATAAGRSTRDILRAYHKSTLGKG